MKKTISWVMALTMAGTMSISALAANDASTLFAPTPSISQQTQQQFIINGQPMQIAHYTTQDGCLMVSVRAIAEALGFEVTWHPDKTIHLNNGTMQCDFTVGENTYIVYTAIPDAVGMSAPFALASAPVIQDGTSYVPITLLPTLFGNDASVLQITDAAVTIQTEKNDTDNMVQMANPLTERKDLQALSDAVGFSVIVPHLPEGYRADTYIDISGELAEIFYHSDTDTVLYRMAKTQQAGEDISGDYTTYSTQKTLTVKGISVTASGDTVIKKAVWEKDGFSYSIGSETGLTDTQIIAIVESVLS